MLFNRAKSIEWWGYLSSLQQKVILKEFNLGYRKPSSLTGREIENIWYEQVGSDAEIIEETFKNKGTQRSPFGIGA